MAISQQWAPPDGLNRPGPRPVRLTTRGKLFVVLGTIFLIAGVGFGLMMEGQVRRDAERERLLRERGANATGTVLSAWLSSDENRTPMVAYQFPANGTEWGGQSSLEKEIWRKTIVGGAIAIRYLPEDPRVNRPTAGAESPMQPWVPWLAGFLFMLPAVMFRWMIRREKRLLAEGSPVAGVVTRVARRKKLTVYYDFQLPTGEEMHGRSSVGAGFAPQTGERVCVLYDPDHPRRNAIYPLETVRLGEE